MAQSGRHLTEMDYSESERHDAIKILPRISVGGISMVFVSRRSAVVDGSLDLSARATSFFI
jgi:hypothetical protein